jgi:flavorubredoxin
VPIEIYCSNPAAQQLKGSLSSDSSDLLSKSFNINVVKTDECLDLGGGHRLQFILTPTPRWPDGMCIYDPANQLLFTNKLFSAHVCKDNGFDVEGWEEYAEDWRFFFDCMLSPVLKQAKAALEKLPVVAQFSVPQYTGRRGLGVVEVTSSL